jgi:hypothetical protein
MEGVDGSPDCKSQATGNIFLPDECWLKQMAAYHEQYSETARGIKAYIATYGHRRTFPNLGAEPMGSLLTRIGYDRMDSRRPQPGRFDPW